ncbi:MAG: putative esterase, partial [Phycisphaerales bacterium]
PDAVRPAGGGAGGEGGGGFAWTYTDEGAWYVEYLVDRFVEDYQIPPGRVVLVGFSQGANLALHLLREKPGLMAGAIVVCGYMEEGQFDGMEAGGARPRVSLIIGQRDPWVRTNRAGVKALEAAGFTAQLQELRGKGHEFPDGAAGAKEFGEAMGFVTREGP